MSPNKHKLKTAISLRYNSEIDQAPKVTAKGRGEVAERIISLAAKNNIPIKEDPDLVQVLANIDIGKEIPSALYHVVAELLAFVYTVNKGYLGKPQK